MDVPSVKGSAFQSVADDVKRLIDAGRIAPEDVAEHLTDKDRGLLDAELTPISWVPIASYGRMLELLAQEEGGDDPAGYLAERGAKAAERLLSGNYAAFHAEPGSWGPRVCRTMIGIGSLLYNFTKWTFETIEDEVFEIDCREAADFPEPARVTAQGFLQWFAESAAGRPMQVTARRAAPDHIVFRIEPR